MKVQEKVFRAKEAIRFISTHDDELMKEIDEALDELKAFIESERKEAVKRRKSIDVYIAEMLAKEEGEK